MKRVYGTPIERFQDKVQRTGDCWEWQGSKNSDGYGNFRCQGRLMKAHRFSYEAHKGPIPEGLEIDHVCRNRSCVNPEHLRAVTRRENMRNLAGVRSDSRTGVRGVGWHKPMQKWHGYVQWEGKQVSVGYFNSIEAAENAVTQKRLELSKEEKL